jgi:hypothetical protein
MHLVCLSIVAVTLLSLTFRFFTATEGDRAPPRLDCAAWAGHLAHPS